MKKTHSRVGLLSSLAIHGLLIGGGFAWLDNHEVEKKDKQESALSMEMVAALLEQPQVAVAPDPIVEEIKEIAEEKPAPEPEPKPEVKPEPEPAPKPDAIPDPTLKPKEDKPKEEKRKKRHRDRKEEQKERKERKERADDKPKERPKRKHEHKPIKALERGPEAKQGIVAKAMPGAVQGNKVVAGVVGGQKNGSQSSTSTTGSTNTNMGNASEISAYKAALQRALQRRASNSYPQREKMMRKTGTVTIKFSVLPSGAISNVSVVNSSGNSNLDAAAVKSAGSVKMPPPPAGFPSQATVPVKFSIE